MAKHCEHDWYVAEQYISSGGYEVAVFACSECGREEVE